MKGKELKIMGLLLRSLCCGYRYTGVDVGHIPGNQVYCRFQEVSSKACMGQAGNMTEISWGLLSKESWALKKMSIYALPNFWPDKTCLAEFSKFTNFQLLGKRVFIVRKWFPWDLDFLWFLWIMDVYTNKILFKHSHAHLFIYCLCPLLCCNRRVIWLWKRPGLSSCNSTHNP